MYVCIVCMHVCMQARRRRTEEEEEEEEDLPNAGGEVDRVTVVELYVVVNTHTQQELRTIATISTIYSTSTLLYSTLLYRNRNRNRNGTKSREVIFKKFAKERGRSSDLFFWRSKRGEGERHGETWVANP